MLCVCVCECLDSVDIQLTMLESCQFLSYAIIRPSLVFYH